ncbi:MAG: hypothetical protein ACLVB3_09465 [Clostridium sp.]
MIFNIVVLLQIDILRGGEINYQALLKKVLSAHMWILQDHHNAAKEALRTGRRVRDLMHRKRA